MTVGVIDLESTHQRMLLAEGYLRSGFDEMAIPHLGKALLALPAAHIWLVIVDALRCAPNRTQFNSRFAGLYDEACHR